MEMTRRQAYAVASLLALMPLLEAKGGPLARETQTDAPPVTHAVTTAESVMAPLQRALAWYQEARIVMQELRSTLDTDFDRGEEQTAQRALLRAFDAARARAAVLDQAGAAETQEATSPRAAARADRRAELRAAIEREERDVARLRAQARASTAAARPALDRELAAATNRLELRRVQLEFVTKLSEVDGAAPDGAVDLPDQIAALRDTVPELSPAGTGAPTVVTTTP